MQIRFACLFYMDFRLVGSAAGPLYKRKTLTALAGIQVGFPCEDHEPRSSIYLYLIFDYYFRRRGPSQVLLWTFPFPTVRGVSLLFSHLLKMLAKLMTVLGSSDSKFPLKWQ